MKKSKFSASKIIEALESMGGGLLVPELYCDLGICSATFYKWRAKYRGMDISMMARMK
jgi:putative transposase